VNIQTDEIRLRNFLDLPVFFQHSGPDILSSLISKNVLNVCHPLWLI